MQCQILFSRENKKNIINVSSAELAQRVVTDRQTDRHTHTHPHTHTHTYTYLMVNGHKKGAYLPPFSKGDLLALVAQSDARLTGDQVPGLIPAWSGNILS